MAPTPFESNLSRMSAARMSRTKKPKTGRPRRNRRRTTSAAGRGGTPVVASKSTASGRRQQVVARRGEIPPGRVRKAWRHVGRWVLRLGVASAVAYAALVGVREGYEYATTSPRFEVRGLVFSPTDHVDDARLRELMALSPGTNILSLDLEQIAQRVVEDPWVARATVTRVLPDTLEVHVTEHRPTAVLMAGGFFLLDEEGALFKPLEPAERGELPIVTGVDRLDLLEDPLGAKDRIRKALEVLAAYQEKRRPRLSEIHVDDTSAVTLYTAELGSQLRLGRTEIRAGLARYDALRAALGQDSDKLAVAHLDAGAGPVVSERVVASFFPARDVPTFVADAEEQTNKAAAAQTEREQELQERGSGVQHGARGSKKRSRLPKYE